MEATGSVCVDSVFVITTGQVKTAPAPWTSLPVWQQTRRFVTGRGTVSVGSVNVHTHMVAQPARPALDVRYVGECEQHSDSECWVFWDRTEEEQATTGCFQYRVPRKLMLRTNL